MKTAVKTTIKGFENLHVSETAGLIYEMLSDKHPFIKLTLLSHDNKKTIVGIKKTSIKLFKQL